jgi:hypothetical protein
LNKRDANMKNIIMNHLLTAIVLATMTGCAALDVEPDYEFKEDKNTGLLIVAVTHKTDTVILRLRSKDNSIDEAIMTHTSAAPMDFDNPKGRLAVIELPPGDYEFYQWETFLPGLRYTSPSFSAPFTIRKGQAVYVGSLYAYVDVTSWGGPRPLIDQELTVTDESERDIALFTKRYPNIQKDNVTVSIPDITEGWGLINK